eukprot:ANDGO_06682.mRNA.1 hypothetical protein SPRG_03327
MDCEVSAWRARPDGSGVLPEYRIPLQSICVHPRWMAHSSVLSRMQQLAAITKQHPLTVSIEQVVTEMIQKTFSVATDAGARALRSSVDECETGTCHLFADAMTYCCSLTWEHSYLHAALRELVETEDETGLRLILGLMVRSARECNARKRDTFNMIIKRLSMPRGAPSSSELCTDRGVLGGAMKDASERAVLAALRLLNRTVLCIEDWKDRSFSSCFLQPSLFTFDQWGDHQAALDADVHGGSVYLALLLATTGIRTSRLPDVSDRVKGVVDFRQVTTAGFENAVQAICSPENIGKSFRGIPVCRCVSKPPISRPLQTTSFIWSAIDTLELAEKAINPREGNAERRTRFAAYLKSYCDLFSSDVLLKRLFQVVSGSVDSSNASSEGLLADCQLVAEFLWPLELVDGVDVRQWVWDLDGKTATFRADRARLLLAAIGIIKDDNWIASPMDSALAVGHQHFVLDDGVLDPWQSRPVIPKEHISLDAAGDIRGGGTGREFLENLLSDGQQPWNKWVHPGYVRRSWILAKFDSPYKVAEYGLCSANDAPNRDPQSWTLWGLAPYASEWTVLHEVPHFWFSRRWEWTRCTIAHPMVVVALRLEITSVREPRDCLQIGHVRFAHHPIDRSTDHAMLRLLIQRIDAKLIDVSVQGHLAAAGSVTGNELLESLETLGFHSWNKWLQFGSTIAPSWMVAEMVVPQTVTGFAVCSASSRQDRDPFSCDVLAMPLDPASSWTEIETSLLFDFHSRSQWKVFTFASPVQARSIKVTFHSASHSADCIQVSQWHLFGHSC